MSQIYESHLIILLEEHSLLPLRSTSILQSRVAAGLYFLGRYLLAGIFLWSGLNKAFFPTQFAEIIGAYGLLPEQLNFSAAIILIVAELAVSIELIFDKKHSLTGAAVLMLLFVAVISYAISLGLDIDCGCFGPNDPEAIAFHDLRSVLYRDLLFLLIIMYLYFWRFANRPKRKIVPANCRIANKEA